MKSTTMLYILCGLIFLGFALPTQAYIDPGTGSFLFQLVIAGALGGLFFIKSIIRSVKLKLSSIFGEKKVKSDNRVENNEQQ